MDGLLLVDKPIGPTSHDVVARARRALGERRIGHTGTLDPLASGLLVLVLGRATRLARFLSASDKRYDAEVRLGFATDTYDARGAPTTAPHAGPTPSRDEIERALDAFRGTFPQQPPAYSAKKIDGTRSYQLARGARRNLSDHPAPAAPPTLPAPANVTAKAIDIVGVVGDRVSLRIDCSAGFYVRSLAHDLGGRLGTGAHVTALRRSRSGDFTLAGAIAMDALERDPGAAALRAVPLAAMLPGLASVVLTPDGVRRAGHGRDLGPEDIESGFGMGALGFVLAGESQSPHPKSRLFIRLLDPSGELVGIAEAGQAAGFLHPSVVLM